MYVFCVCIWCLHRPEDGIGCPGTGGFGPSYKRWELNPGSLQEQQVLLTAELSVLPFGDHRLMPHAQSSERTLISQVTWESYQASITLLGPL